MGSDLLTGRSLKKLEIASFDAFNKHFPHLIVHERLIITADLFPNTAATRGLRIVPFAEWALEKVGA
jgi:hypothetical protein